MICIKTKCKDFFRMEIRSDFRPKQLEVYQKCLKSGIEIKQSEKVTYCKHKDDGTKKDKG